MSRPGGLEASVPCAVRVWERWRQKPGIEWYRLEPDQENFVLRRLILFYPDDCAKPLKGFGHESIEVCLMFSEKIFFLLSAG